MGKGRGWAARNAAQAEAQGAGGCILRLLVIAVVLVTMAIIIFYLIFPLARVLIGTLAQIG